MLYVWAAVIAVPLFLLWIVATFNTLVKKNNRVNNAWSDVDVQLKRRYDLVQNLVETVKGYKTYEASVLEDVVRARSNAMNEANVVGHIQAESALSTALKNLFIVTENYPLLRSSDNFLKLQDQLSSLENDIQSARRYYNAATRELNNAVQIFPVNIIAGLLRFKQSEFFGADENEKNSTKVSL